MSELCYANSLLIKSYQIMTNMSSSREFVGAIQLHSWALNFLIGIFHRNVSQKWSSGKYFWIKLLDRDK